MIILDCFYSYQVTYVQVKPVDALIPPHTSGVDWGRTGSHT